jgi:hypothetical protein
LGSAISRSRATPGGAAPCEEDASLRAEQESDEKRDEEKDGGVLVFDAQTGEQSEEQPGARSGGAFRNARTTSSAPIQKPGSKEFMER